VVSRLLGVAVLIALSFATACGGAEPDGPARALHPMVGEPVPPFEQTGIGGERVVLPVPGAKVTLVDFFASWCEPCARSLPEVDAFVTEHEAEGVRLVLVGLDEDPDTAGAFLDRIGVKRPATLDTRLAIAKRFKVEKLPVTFVVDASSRIVWSGKDVAGAHDAALTALGITPPAPTAAPASSERASRPLRLDPPAIR